jgi:16S rRNA (guanine527-N7)-methyltransferase
MDSVSKIIKYFPSIPEFQKLQLEKFARLFEEWNTKVNLISRKDMDFLVERHILHSLAIAKFIAFKKGTKILDVGTGGGFPGLPLAILFPEVQFTLVDSIGKKIKVVDDIVEQLNLNNVIAIHERAENVKGKFDFIVSRAVTRLINFLPWVKNKVLSKNHHSRKNGIIYLKGGDLSEELSEVKGRIDVINLSEYYDEYFFETKKIVYIPIS